MSVHPFPQNRGLCIKISEQLALHPEINTGGIPMNTGNLPRLWCSEAFSRVALINFPISTTTYIFRLTGISKRTIENHLNGQRPNVDHALTYFDCGRFGEMLAIEMKKGEGAFVPRRSAGRHDQSLRHLIASTP